MFDLIALLILLASLLGIGAVLYRKVPVLVDIPEETISPIDWQGLFLKAKTRSLPAVKNFWEKTVNLPLVKNLIYKIKTSQWIKDSLEKLKDSSLVKRLKESAVLKKLTPSKSFSFEKLLQKMLSRIRVLVLKIDHKTSDWLQKLRERAKKRASSEKDDYWQKLRKITKK